MVAVPILNMSRKVLYFVIIFCFGVSFLLAMMNNFFLRSPSEEKGVIKITNMELSQGEDHLKVAVLIEGASDEPYRLDIEVKAGGYVKGLLIRRSEMVYLRFPKQKFHFQFLFSDLTKTYYHHLLEYIPVLERKFGIEEVLIISAHLATYSAQKDIPSKTVGTADAAAQFFFSCFQEACQIIQSAPSTETP